MGKGKGEGGRGRKGRERGKGEGKGKGGAFKLLYHTYVFTPKRNRLKKNGIFVGGTIILTWGLNNAQAFQTP